MRQVRVPLWSASAIADAGTLTSPAIDLRRADFESLLFQVTSVLSAVPDIKIEYAVSQDGVTFGGFDDETDLIASSVLLANPEGVHTIPGVTSVYDR